jgi:hypothetical protein
MTKVSHLLGPVDLGLAVVLIAAAEALAFLVAQSPFREALTVHLQAIYLRALAALHWLVSRGKIELANGSKYLVVLRNLSLVNEQIKQIFVGGLPLVAALQFCVRDKFE